MVKNEQESIMSTDRNAKVPKKGTRTRRADGAGHTDNVAPQGRRERRAAETRIRLFRCALALFAEHGLPNVTVEDITEAADVGKGTFFNYFETKDHVLLRFRDKRINIIQSFLNENRTSGVPLISVLNSLAIALTREFGMNAALFQSFIIAAFTNGAVRSQMS